MHPGLILIIAAWSGLSLFIWALLRAGSDADDADRKAWRDYQRKH